MIMNYASVGWAQLKPAEKKLSNVQQTNNEQIDGLWQIESVRVEVAIIIHQT